LTGSGGNEQISFESISTSMLCGGKKQHKIGYRKNLPAATDKLAYKGGVSGVYFKNWRDWRGILSYKNRFISTSYFGTR